MGCTQSRNRRALLEIKTLLPAAMSAGLATAFKDMKESFNDPISKYKRMLYNSLALIIILSV